MSTLSIQRVGRTFAGLQGAASTLALQPTDLDVRHNDFITILGPSGCGKSTLLRIVAGLDAPSTGQVLLDGAPVAGPGADRGMVFQSYTLFPWLTVRQNICFGLREKGMPAAEQAEIAARFIAEVGLSGFEGHYPKQLSGGMQQRVALARALACNPSALLLDEPFAALNPMLRSGLRRELGELRQRLGIPMVVITHDIDDIATLADHVFVLDDGRVVREVDLRSGTSRDHALESLRPEPLAPDQLLRRQTLARALGQA